MRLKEQMAALRTAAEEANAAKQRCVHPCVHAHAPSMHRRLKKERDYHKLNHRRIAQEKNKLINEIKRYNITSHHITSHHITSHHIITLQA